VDVATLDSVDHLVVLMLENRSFDHMLGFLYPGDKASAGFNGLTGKETNQDSHGRVISVFPISSQTDNAYWYPLCNPVEGYEGTNEQLFGTATPPHPPTPTNSGFVRSFEAALAKPEDPPLRGATESAIMGIYTPELLPVLSTLAKSYAVSDSWFASVPTETMPNRAFALAGTSLGRLADTEKYFDTDSIFGALSNHGVPWKVYGYSSQPVTQMDFRDIRAAPPSHFGTFVKDFVAEAAADDLPAFAFLEPEWANYREAPDQREASENDQHPVSSLATGERFIFDVYRALRAGPGWNKTLLVITYDEHGGCFDHVPPPGDAVAPDDSPGEQGFGFTRFGVRVPTILVSPFIAAGSVYRAPENGPPFDHTSLLATIRARWNAGPLRARDAVAPDIASVLTLTEARTDDALAQVQPPSYEPPVGTGAIAAGTRVTRILRAHARMAARLPIAGSEIVDPDQTVADLATSADHRQFIEDRLTRWNEAKRNQGLDEPAHD
jgi:phospholipase C